MPVLHTVWSRFCPYYTLFYLSAFSALLRTHVYFKTNFQKKMVHWVPMGKIFDSVNHTYWWLAKIHTHFCMYACLLMCICIFFPDFHESKDSLCILLWGEAIQKKWGYYRVTTNRRRVPSTHVKYTVQTIYPIPGISILGIYNLNNLFNSYYFFFFWLYMTSQGIPHPHLRDIMFLQYFESLCHKWLNELCQNIPAFRLT